MNIVAPTRPIGFRPAEISGLTNGEVIAQHAEEAAFLWSLRARAITEPHYSLSDLLGLDRRIDAHLQGLQVAGNLGWRLCHDAIAEGGAAELFAASVLAFRSADRQRMSGVLAATDASQAMRSGLVSALGWLPMAAVSQWIKKLLVSHSPLHRAIGVAASAVRRQDPGSALAAAIEDENAILRARGLRAAGEFKRCHLGDAIAGHLHEADPGCRFWASWSLTLIGSKRALPILMRFVEDGSTFSDRALQLVLRAMPVGAGRGWIRDMVRHPKLLRSAVIGVGVIGDSVSIPWLIGIMGRQELAREAGEAFSMITGADLHHEDLSSDAPAIAASEESADVDDITPLDYATHLPWPNQRAVEQWWARNRHGFAPGNRYLAGQPIDERAAMGVLANRRQRMRAGAALELALSDASYPLFEIRAPAVEQRRSLMRWIS